MNSCKKYREKASGAGVAEEKITLLEAEGGDSKWATVDL